VRPRHPGSCGAGGAQKNFADLVKAAIPEHAREKPIELWWQDEARVGQQGRLTRVWAERGSRVRIDRAASDPFTTHQVLAEMHDIPLRGKRVVVQRYGETNRELQAALASEGAEVIEIVTYRFLRDSIEPMNSLIGITRLLRARATAVDPRCQINMTP
jgi:hypothetical protein